MSALSEESLILKFRGLFPDKSKKELKSIFIDMTKSVYKNVGKDEKMTEIFRNRWVAVATTLRSLNLIEFKIAMYRFKSAGLTFEEIRRVFIRLDTSENGRVEYDEFLAGIRGELSTFRQRLVIYIFRKLDRNSSGYIEERELTKFYKCSNLLEILDGSITPKAKSKEFVQNIGTVAVPDGPEGRISVEQFIDYYLSMSLVFKGSDEEFRSEVLSEWRAETDNTDSATPFTLSPTQPDGKNPAPPASVAPSNLRNTSPRAKKVVASPAPDELSGENELQNQAVPHHQTSPILRRGSADHDQLSPTSRIQLMKFQSPNSRNRFSPPLQQPQPRYLSPHVLRDHHTDPLLTPVHPLHSQHHLHSHITTFSPPTGDFNSPVRSTDQIISDNLNYLLASLQQKVHEQEATIEAQKRLIHSQQQTLKELHLHLEIQKLLPASSESAAIQLQQAAYSPPHRLQLQHQHQHQRSVGNYER